MSDVEESANTGAGTKPKKRKKPKKPKKRLDVEAEAPPQMSAQARRARIIASALAIPMGSAVFLRSGEHMLGGIDERWFGAGLVLGSTIALMGWLEMSPAAVRTTLLVAAAATLGGIALVGTQSSVMGAFLVIVGLVVLIGSIHKLGRLGPDATGTRASTTGQRQRGAA